jgi:hypothetical protein
MINGGPKPNSIFQLLVCPRNLHHNLEHMEETTVETLHMLDVYTISSLFWQYTDTMSIGFGSLMNCINFSIN